MLAELQYEADLQERMLQVVGGGRGSPILRLMPAALGLTEVRVVSAPERAEVRVPVAVDPASPSATARVAVALSRLQENPKQLADALALQGVSISVDDLSVAVGCASPRPPPPPPLFPPRILSDTQKQTETNQ